MTKYMDESEKVEEGGGGVHPANDSASFDIEDKKTYIKYQFRYRVPMAVQEKISTPLVDPNCPHPRQAPAC